MNFHKFHSIENVYSQKTISNILSDPVSNPDKKWVVLEKTHGANLNFTTDGNDIKIGKRTSFTDGTFFNCHFVFDKYKDAILQLFRLISPKESLAVYGELIGGKYPGVPAVKGVSTIQKGVFYCPGLEFYAFDIRVDGNYLPYDLCVKYFEQVGLFYAKILFEGSFQECLDYSKKTNDESSTIPSQLGLPELSNNIREGNVIKPIIPVYIKETFVILKDKNEKFNEKQKNPNMPDVISDTVLNTLEDIKTYITVQRYNNVVSKIGFVTKNDTTKLIGLLVKDALDDWKKDNKCVDKQDMKIITKKLTTEARNIVLSQF